MEEWNSKKYSINQKKVEHRKIKDKWEIYTMDYSDQIRSVAKSCLTLRPHGLQHAGLPCYPYPSEGRQKK